MPTPITIKRFDGSNWNTVLHPITTGQNVYGSTLSLSTTPLLDANDKINSAFLPFSQKYEHNVFVLTDNIRLMFRFETSSSTSLTYTTLAKALYDRGHTSSTSYCPACGFYGTQNITALVVGVYGDSTSNYLHIHYISLVTYDSNTETSTIQVSPVYAGNSADITLTSSSTISDTVITK